MSTFTDLKVTQPADPPADGGESGGVVSTEGGGGTLGRLASFVPSLDTLKERAGAVWSRSRPWGEFLNTTQMSKPELGDLMERMKENLEYYAFNYLVILLVLSAITVLTSPLAFLGGIFIFVAYMYLFVFNPEPVSVAGITLDNHVKAAAIMTFSLVVLWLTGAGATFTSLLVVVAVIALAHAALRRPPGEADFETAYTPATV